jgi:hypothetical protein
MSNSILELQQEYQDYVIAHRVRRLLGGKLTPPAFLNLAKYAQKRLRRQKVARELVTVKPFQPERLIEVDALTDQLCFGMWRSPMQINEFLAAAWRLGGHVILESESEFAAQILTPSERAKLEHRGLEIARFYHLCLRVGAAALNPEEMEMAVNRVEALAQHLPLFTDALPSVPPEA